MKTILNAGSINATVQFAKPPVIKEYDYNTAHLYHFDSIPIKDSSFRKKYDGTIDGSVKIANIENPINRPSLFFTNGCVYFNRYVPIHNDLYFTHEFFYMYTGTSSNYTIYSKFGNSKSYGFEFSRKNTEIGFYVRYDKTPHYTWTIKTSSIPSNNVWHHVAVVRNLEIAYLFIDGIKKAETSLPWTSSYSLKAPANVFTVGGTWYNSHDFNSGYISEFRISSIARYTENFTPPTKPFSPYLEG